MEERLVSVLMPVHCQAGNQEAAIVSITSILEQTWNCLELLIVDDASPYPVSQLLADYGIADERARVVVHKERQGITGALLTAASLARGEFIARLDADDKAEPQRLKKQVERFLEEPETVLLGTWYVVEYEGGRTRQLCPRDDDQYLRRSLLLTNPFCHSSVMFRRDAYEQVGGYNAAYDTSQDLALWFDLARIGKLGIIEDFLVTRTVSQGAVSVGPRARRQVYNSLQIRLTKATGSKTAVSRVGIAAIALASAAYQHFRNVLLPKLRSSLIGRPR